MTYKALRMLKVVAIGIEPISKASEAPILSVELRDLDLRYFDIGIL